METMMRTSRLDGLVRASRSVNMPTADIRERNRTRLAARIAAGLGAAVATAESQAAAAGGAPGAGAGGAAGLAGGVAKWVIVSIVLVAASATAVGLYVSRTRLPPTMPPLAVASLAAPAADTHEPTPPAGEPVAPGAEISAAASPDPSNVPAEPGGGAMHVRRASSASPAASTVGARAFERELQLLRSARRALDSGSPALALSLLDEYAADFPHGALKVECQAARILALCAAGRVSSARQARDQFLKQQPGSPLAEQLRTSCGGSR